MSPSLEKLRSSVETTRGANVVRLAVLSTGRQDWGILRSTCGWLRSAPNFDFRLLVGGMACSDRHGRVDRAMEGEGFALAERLDWMVDGTSTHADAARALGMIGDALERQRPEALLLVGDRYETMAAAVAATTLKVALVHLHGGEETEGAFDNAFRHAITKLSHLHLVSHELYARRVVGMGEDPSTVHVVGAPGLDNLQRADLATRAELASFLGVDLAPPVVVVTLHPTTLSADAALEPAAVVAAMDEVAATYVITLPNSDPGNSLVREALLAAARKPRRVAVDALGERRYWGLMRIADAMLGNSSSALIEAPAVGLPAVNVGERQKGRLRGVNVVDVEVDARATAEALRRVLSPEFRRRADAAPSPFGDGHAAARIATQLTAWEPPRPPRKKHYEARP